MVGNGALPPPIQYVDASGQVKTFDWKIDPSHLPDPNQATLYLKRDGTFYQVQIPATRGLPPGEPSGLVKDANAHVNVAVDQVEQRLPDVAAKAQAARGEVPTSVPRHS